MSDYLTPGIGRVIPLLTQNCEELVRQDLIRCLTQKTQEWCEGDPELAETILEGKKTLSGCVKYVLEQAAAFIAKNVAAMPKEELDALPTQDIGGRKATMAGGMVSDEKAYEWARDYYYKTKETTVNAGNTSKKGTGKTPGKKDSQKGEQKKNTSGSGISSTAAQAQVQDTDDKPEQMTLLGAAEKSAA